MIFIKCDVRFLFSRDEISLVSSFLMVVCICDGSLSYIYIEIEKAFFNHFIKRTSYLKSAVSFHSVEGL